MPSYNEKALNGTPFPEACKVLMICTSADRLGDTEIGTGAWAESIAAPYYLFDKKGYALTIASIEGGKIPLDPKSITGQHLTPCVRKLLSDDYALSRLNESLTVVLADAFDYDAIFITDGHGIMWDGVYNSEVKRLVEDAHRLSRVIAAVGHGPGALVQAKVHGKPLLADKQVTGCSNSEEEELGRKTLVPFLVETKLRQMGALYRRGKVDNRPFVLRTGHLITGQNGASSELTAAMVIEALSLGVRMIP